MDSVKIYLENTAAAESFVQTMRQFEGEYDLALGSYTVDAKSILGVFALGIGKVLDLVFVNSKGEDRDVMNAVERYRMAAYKVTRQDGPPYFYRLLTKISNAENRMRKQWFRDPGCRRFPFFMMESNCGKEKSMINLKEA